MDNSSFKEGRKGNGMKWITAALKKGKREWNEMDNSSFKKGQEGME